MKKIFSMIVVALVALFATTSCKLSGGTEPNPNKANELLWGRVNNVINQQHDHFKAVAHLNDAMLNKEYVDNVYAQCEIEQGVDTYMLKYVSSNETYCIKTDGKRLDEGGEWIVYYRMGKYMEFAKVGVATGVVGETSRFNLLVDNSEYGYTYYASSYKVESEIEYEYEDERECLCVKINTFKGCSSSQPADSDYVIEFETVEPLIIRASIEEGKINILYKDIVKDTKRELTVQIANKIITFVPQNSSNW